HAMDVSLRDKLYDCLGADAMRAADVLLPGAARSTALFPSSAEAAGEALALLDGAGESVLPWGGGTALLPMEPAPSVILATERLTRWVDYQRDDMTATAEAGMPREALQAILAEHGQRAPLAPPRPDRATLGGIVATDRTGPGRCAHRTPR